MNKSNRVLVVEDDAAIVRALSSFLTDEGFLCKSANGQAEALRLFEQEEFDIVLDVSLADGSGFVVCSAMKSKKDIPIIFLTASGDEHSVVTGLELGADDYIAKPFEVVEMLARVESVLRRYKKTNDELVEDDVVINFQSRSVTKAGKTLDLTHKEFELLVLLIRNKNIALYRDVIYENVWGNDYVGDSRTIDLHIQRLRRKLDWGDKIQSVYKVGYKLV